MLLQGFPVGLRLGVKFTQRTRETVRPITVGNVVRPPAEGVDCAHRLPLLVREVLERVIEVPSLPYRQFLAIPVGQAEQFCWRSLRPNRRFQMGKGVNEFVLIVEQANKMRGLLEGLHRGPADRLDGFACQRNTRPEAFEWRDALPLKSTASRRCIALQRQHEVQRFAAFQHLVRLWLPITAYQSPARALGTEPPRRFSEGEHVVP